MKVDQHPEVCQPSIDLADPLRSVSASVFRHQRIAFRKVNGRLITATPIILVTLQLSTPLKRGRPPLTQLVQFPHALTLVAHLHEAAP